MLAIEVDTAWNMLIPWKVFKSLIKLFFSCVIFYGFTFYIKFLPRVRYLYMRGKIHVVHWGSYGLKQGNTLQNFQITNHMIHRLFYFLWFFFLYQKLYQRQDLGSWEGKYMSPIEIATAWNRGIPCKITNKNLSILLWLLY